MKMKNTIRTFIAGVTALVVLASCNLELAPTTSVVYDDDTPLFQTENDVESFLYGVLASYRALCSGSFDQSSDVMCDYFNATQGFGNNYGSVHRADATFTPSDEYVESMWSSHYSAIKNYNIAIEQADYVDESLKESAEVLKGIALFCRASAYLTLTRHFGVVYDPATASDELSVPLILVYDQEAKPYRATVEEVYEQIRWDLEDASTYLENRAGVPAASMPTIDAVKAVMARYYLDVKDYASAAKMAMEVIESPAGYALASTPDEMLNEYSIDSGSEPIVQMYASKAEGTIAKTLYTSVSNDATVGKYFQPYFVPSANLLNAYEPTDFRYQMWFSKALYPVFMNGSYYNNIYVFVKYLGNPYLYSGDIENGAHAAKPLKIAEMYLIAAEAYAQQNNTAKAKSILNTLQRARNASVTAGTLDAVKKEWYKEMVGDGHLFICAKRWGDGFPARPLQAGAANVCMTGPSYEERKVDADSRIFNWPVPSYEIKITPSLEQNPGYSAE